MTKPSSLLQRLRHNQSGNVAYITAALFFPMLGLVGSGVDLGRAYMAQTRLQQACDAGVLAGRKVMAEGNFDTEARTAATTMFNFNYPAGIYQSQRIRFIPEQISASEVKADASATIRTAIMYIFGKTEFNLAVSCTAKLEISNADIMFVLDTTGSMADTNSGDSVSKISALRTEVMAFFDTLASAQQGNSIIRYGVMPYSSNVNVGRVLQATNPDFVSSSLAIPSREPNIVSVQDPTTTTNANYTNWVQTVAPTTTNYGTFSGYTSSNCSSAFSFADISRINVVSSNSTTTTDSAGNQITTTTTEENWNVYRYGGVWSSSACRMRRATGTAVKTTVTTATTPPPRNVFQNYTYRTINYDVTNVLNGAGMDVPAGDGGANIRVNWNGCILERDTVAFDDQIASIPSGAKDLDIDGVPGGESMRWHIAAPNIAFPRASSAGSSQSTSPTNLVSSNDYNSYAEGTNASGGYAACPTQAMKLTALQSSDRSILQNYINSLIAVGGTYHDVGMTWGARFISPTGIFASENNSAPNGMPISRHIIFMTDGEMAPNPGIYGFQGVEYLMGRVGSTNTTELIARHNRRFLEACAAAKARNITVWVVSFGTTLTNELKNCASGDKAYQANNATQLRQQFQSIAQQISRLRISE